MVGEETSILGDWTGGVIHSNGIAKMLLSRRTALTVNGLIRDRLDYWASRVQMSLNLAKHVWDPQHSSVMPQGTQFDRIKDDFEVTGLVGHPMRCTSFFEGPLDAIRPHDTSCFRVSWFAREAGGCEQCL